MFTIRGLSLCILDCPGTHHIKQADLNLTEIRLPSASQVLCLKVGSTMPSRKSHFKTEGFCLKVLFIGWLRGSLCSPGCCN